MYTADLIVINATIITLDTAQPVAWGVAVHNGRILRLLANQEEVAALTNSTTQIIDAQGRTIIPGLNDSHIHIIREGLNYALEVRWDNVTSLKDALDLLRQHVAKTPKGQWVRVVGGWSEYQFTEKRLPTLHELNEISSEVPIFVMHLYERVLLNTAALAALGDLETLTLTGGTIIKDDHGNPTGILLAHPGASLLYSALARAPHLNHHEQVDSTKAFLRELNRLGVTSAIDAGGGYQQFPENYAVITELSAKKQLTVRIGYYLFTQRPGHEYEDFASWVAHYKPEEGDHFYRLCGAGEMLVYSAADYENFFQVRPTLSSDMEKELTPIIQLLVAHRWPFRIHATYNESITRMLDVIESVHKTTPLDGLRWFFDHAETISDHNLNRVHALGGGIAIQNRMAYQGEYFIQRYGKKAAAYAPPIKKMLNLGIPVGAGTDATRVASYNPWVCMHWLVTGKTVGGTQLYDQDNILDRTQALALWTTGSAWFSGEQDKKGRLTVGQFADFVVLSDDYMTIPADHIPLLESVLTIVNGAVVYAHDAFASLL